MEGCCRSVIVSVRGTWSMEDIITDSVADPMLLKDWLPKGDFSLFCFQARLHCDFEKRVRLIKEGRPPPHWQCLTMVCSCLWDSSIVDGEVGCLHAEFCEANADADHMWAHSGIVGAADAVLVDLEANGILKALLEAQDTTPEQQAAERQAFAAVHHKCSLPATWKQLASRMLGGESVR